MTCSTCGHHNPPEARFCGVCGSPMAEACPHCGHTNSHEAQFCSSCSATLADATEVSEAHPAEPPGPPPAGIPPKDIGGLLDETFALYRNNFRLFFLIALVPSVPQIVAVFIPGTATAPAVLLALASILLYIPAGGATVHAVAQRYLGRTIDVAECYRHAWWRVLSLFVAWLVITLALIGSLILWIILIGIPLFFYLQVVLFFAAEVIMIEGRGPIAALGRSRELVRGSWWRVFGIGAAFVLIFVALVISAALAAIIVGYFNLTIGSILFAALNTLILPVMLVGRTLVYLDLRARKERYSLDALASDIARSFVAS